MGSLVKSCDARLTNVAHSKLVSYHVTGPALSVGRDSGHVVGVELKLHFLFHDRRLAASEGTELAEVISARLTVIEQLLMLQISKIALLASNRCLREQLMCLAARRSVTRKIRPYDSTMHNKIVILRALSVDLVVIYAKLHLHVIFLLSRFRHSSLQIF